MDLGLVRCCKCINLCSPKSHNFIFPCLSIKNDVFMIAVLCMGKSIDTIKSAIDNMEVDDVMLRTLLIAGKVSQACQLLLDNYIWIASLGRVSVDTKPLVKLASRFSFLALVFRLARNVYDIVRIVNASSRQAEVREKSLDCSVREKSLDCSVREKSLTMLTSNGCVRHGLLNCVLLRRRQVFVDVAKNLLDIPLALSGIAALRLSEGSRGLLGVVSSYLSVLVVWNPALKLIPS